MFRDRIHAGGLLAKELETYRAERPIIVGVARGGVPVAFEVAHRLDAQLEVIVVRKIGAPADPERAIGAIAEGGEAYVREDALREMGTGDEWIAAVAAREGPELARRVHAYRGGRPMRDLTGRTVIVVDDGVATGATARAAGRTVRRRGAARVVLAAPVIAASAEPELGSDFDAIVAVERAEVFFAVGQWYERFEQVTDDDVATCLHRAVKKNGASDVERIEPAPTTAGGSQR